MATAADSAEKTDAPREIQVALKPGWWKWMIALAASLGAILEVIDTSIVNVALTDMQGNLGATLSEIGWVVTGYAVANVVMIPLSAWLGDYFGKKKYFIFCLVGFTLASVLCGFANSLPMLVIARVLQGLAGGGLLAKAQAILFETFPREEQGTAQAVFGLGVMIGPAIGPTLGGYITDTIGWRWIFFINIPFGILAVVMAALFFLPDKVKAGMNRRVDWWGIALLTLGLACFQTMLEEGQTKDWFDSPFIITMAVLSFIGLATFVWRELSIDYPAVNLRVLRYKSLAAGSVFSMVLGMGLYGALFAIPIFTQSMLHYTAMQTGLLMLPSAIVSGCFMMLSSQLTRWLDPRLVIAVGAVVLSLTLFSLAGINPDSSQESLFWPLIWRGIGTVMMFLPLTLATLGPIPRKDIAAASGFYNLTRQIGGSIGIAILTALLAWRENFHRAVLSEHVSLYDPMVRQRIASMAAGLQQHGADAATAKSQAYSIVDGMLNMQAAILSFSDIFWLVGIAFILSLGLLFFLGKPASADVPTDVH
jgi:DHA2 family multidrug resistance protein